jgi:fumarate hydratase subunit alpha
MVRQLDVNSVTGAVAELCVKSCYYLGEDVVSTLKKVLKEEKSPLGRETISYIIENAVVSGKEVYPLCQDCGSAVIFIEVGQELQLIGGDISKAITQGVRQGYQQGYLRKSIVEQPYSTRKNTGDNTPPIVHTEIVAGDTLKVSFMAKGSGSENMSGLKMLKPAEGRQGIIEYVLNVIEKAGGNACPPLIVGIGIGGNAEKAMLMAKKVLLKPIGERSKDPETAQLEEEILQKVNKLGIGPMGFGGTVTALDVKIETMPCHMASLPLAVNLQCHSARHHEVIL